MTGKRLAAWFAFVCVLASFSRWEVRYAWASRCSLDGNRIKPIYQVDLVLEGGTIRSFCCVRCASDWPEVPVGSYWQVRDEVTGKVIDATRARFVESNVVTVPSRQDTTHVFKVWADAKAHIEQYEGDWIANPFGAADD